MSMRAQELVREFGENIGLPDFALEKSGMARLRLDGKVVVDFEHDAGNDVLHVYAPIASAAHCSPQAWRLLLEANLFLDRSGGAACAFDQLTGDFMACLRLDLERLDCLTLMRRVHHLADAVERL